MKEKSAFMFVLKIFLIWIFIFGVFLLIPYVSAAPITLHNLTIETEDTWCFNQTYEIMIKPTDINGTLVILDGVNISMSNLSPEWGPVFVSENEILTSGLIPLEYEEINSTILSILVDQNGKKVTKLKNIELTTKNCTNLEPEKLLVRMEKFVDEHQGLLIIGFFALLAFVLIIVIFKNIK